MAVDRPYTLETSINYHQGGPNMEPAREKNAPGIRGKRIFRQTLRGQVTAGVSSIKARTENGLCPRRDNRHKKTVYIYI